MYSYFYGTVISVNKKTITFDCTNIGYAINVSHPEAFEINRKIHLYVYAQYTSTGKNGFIEDVYGFKTYQEKDLFLSLMRCQGIGPKTSLQICANDTNVIRQLIAQQDVTNLASIKGISEKLAKVIVETLHTYYLGKVNNTSTGIMSELFSALNALGYKDTDVQYAKDQLNKSSTTETDLSNLIAEAIKIIMARNQPVVNETYQ